MNVAVVVEAAAAEADVVRLVLLVPWLLPFWRCLRCAGAPLLWHGRCCCRSEVLVLLLRLLLVPSSSSSSSSSSAVFLVLDCCCSGSWCPCSAHALRCRHMLPDRPARHEQLLQQAQLYCCLQYSCAFLCFSRACHQCIHDQSKITASSKWQCLPAHPCPNHS